MLVSLLPVVLKPGATACIVCLLLYMAAASGACPVSIHDLVIVDLLSWETQQVNSVSRP